MLAFTAIIIFFTRLPFFRNRMIPDEYFKNIIYYWSMAGWLTASVMMLVLYLSSLLFPISVAVMLAIASRLLLTGALHEDGLADFFDGFGGGISKERILAIMKDSHIGCYGVLGLIIYFLLLFSLLSALPVYLACVAILVADPFCKGLSSFITVRLSYARTAETSKVKVVYDDIKAKYFLYSISFALVPLLIIFGIISPIYYLAILLPVAVFFLLTAFMSSKIQGYTGDCVGALFLMTELSFYLSFVALVRLV
ncbi:adenosylcobinamide-GDP ribazoletransferase [Entomomonas asaccharolytica]|uniref:Adenosylcobinamide-GDP ribazoletransferase n=2 Tax=Entomomonas asaccharolytica TaxID=2785331 RepID=A0A974NGU0_9GAMM|nr:adenosylcobinamide-GDP ribazoletransferase [Entomomonas asaccharolytica]QQP86471.1 adenosylcobinamide-GDP ribazoletransferase [Entomomonas asaccharolytica]